MAGGSSGGKPGGPKKANIQIIPLIDVVFFLLATFVLFTLSLNKSDGLTVSLPAAETGKARETAGTVTITVSVDGSLGWNKEQISLEEFLIRLQTYYRTDGENAKILINGDENTLFVGVRYVFDEARKIGFKKVFLETRVRAAGQ
ncbi:MAG: biopolymer transporter ExbD [Verrucomicrobia bacterium]|nr:biopolymer transporter ExbD [Verrucomicrobiota bacterium]